MKELNDVKLDFIMDFTYHVPVNGSFDEYNVLTRKVLTEKYKIEYVVGVYELKIFP